MANNYNEIGRFVTDLYEKVLVHGDQYNWLSKDNDIDVETFRDYGFVLLPYALSDKLGNYRVSNEENDYQVVGSNVYTDYNGNVAEGSRSGYKIGGDSVKYNLYRVRFIRSLAKKYDKVDLGTKGGQRLIAIGNEAFFRTAVVPERNAIYTSIILDTTSTGLGNRAIEEITTENVVDRLLEGFLWTFNHGADQTDQVILMNMATWNKLIKAKDFINYRSVGSYTVQDGDKEVSFEITKFNNRPIILLSEDRDYSDVVLTNDGYKPSSTSRHMNFAIVKASALHPIDKLNEVIIQDETVLQFYGFQFNYLFWFDLIIPYTEYVGFYASLSNTLISPNTTDIGVVSEFGKESGKTVIRAVLTTPPAIKWSKIYIKETAFEQEVGATQVGGTLVEYNSPFTPSSASVYVAITDASGVIVAKSSRAVELKVAE